ncbi:MAG: hypothetical protein JWM41_1810 [Gemmatimonadetes bacterium]|nr:hypothetical protein [Gemmatimonadota bacterium]
MTIISVKSQSFPAGENPPEAMALRVTDASGARVSGQPVTWTVTSGGGKVALSTAITDSTGVALALWVLGPTSATQTLTASNPRVATPAVFTGTVPIGTITFAATSTKYYVGDTLPVAATVKDTKGTVLTGLPPMFVRDTSIVAQLSTGALVGRGDGVTWAVATVGLLNTPKDSVRLDVYRTLHGTVWTYDDAALPTLRAYSTNGTVTDSADVSAAGTYRIKLTSHTVGWASEVLIDAVNKSGRAYFPALMPVAADCSVRAGANCVGSDINADITFVLVPTQYRVKRGVYAGKTLTVELNDAMVTSLHTGPSYLSTSGQYQQPLTANGNAPRLQNLYAALEQTWFADSFPIGVAFHRGCCSSHAISADDSVQVMRALSTIQNTLGYTIWKPINDSPTLTADRDKATSRVLIFQYDTSVAGAVTARGGTGPLTDKARAPAPLLLNDFVVTGWRGSAVDHVSVFNQVSQAQAIVWNPTVTGQLPQDIIMHEAMHTLGVGHGCSWPSTQSYCGLAPPDTMPSFQDAAYLLLAMDVKLATWKHQALHSLTAALFGERAIILHVDPIPAPWTLPDPGSIPTANDVANPKRPRGGARWP